MKQWYEELYSDYAETYEKEVFTKGTTGEVDFFEKEVNFNKSIKILDVGCGTGRHSIELAKRGYNVTGIDLSENQLKKAEEKAKAANLNIKFFRKDARDFNFSKEFDLIIMLCEGAFPLMETDEMNYKILENVSNSLKDNGKLIFTTLSALFPLFHSVKDYLNAAEKGERFDEHSFDLMTFREKSSFEITEDSGNKKTLNCNERYYIPSEITWMLKSLGFKKVDIFGSKLGAYSRNDKLTTEDFEMLVIAER